MTYEQASYTFFSISIVIGMVLVMYSYTDRCRKERKTLFTLLATGTISLPSLLEQLLD